MFEILRKSLRVGVVTSAYPTTPPQVSPHARGQLEVDYDHWRDPRAAATACPTGALHYDDQDGFRTVILDLARCIFCAQCAEVDPAIRLTPRCELARTQRGQLQEMARYRLSPDGTHAEMTELRRLAPIDAVAIPGTGQDLKETIRRVLKRSLHIREVDAGSCNGCEVEIQALNSPLYDLERLGIHFVASPRHADLLLVTGPVTRNMELALRKTFEAMPPPRLVVAVGACGCSGGIFGRNYATCGAVESVIPVDVFIPGCPPNPHALLHGILLAVGRLSSRTAP